MAESCRSLRLASPPGKDLIPLPQRHSIRGGRTSFVRAIFLWLRLAPPPWAWASRRCRQAHPFIIKHSRGSIRPGDTAAFGAAMAAPDRRVVLRHRATDRINLTAQEVSQFGRLGLQHRDLRAQQFRLPDRAAAVQRSRRCLQRYRAMALHRTAPGTRLRRMVHGTRHDLRRVRPGAGDGGARRFRCFM